MTPYYDKGGITIYHGDAREIAPGLSPVDSIITDPVWPNAVVKLFGHDDPQGMLHQVLEAYGPRAGRVVIHLGVDSDPRFLKAVPSSYPFLRACWLRFARPSYKGRLLNGSEVAYVFGTPPPAGEHFLMSGESRTEGEFCNTNASSRTKDHPCPRRLSHVAWLVKWFGGNLVLDPFMGSGTTALACKNQGVRFIGCEIEEKYCEAAVRRMAQEVLFTPI